MTCVCSGSLVDAVGRDGSVYGVEIERLTPNDVIRDPVSGADVAVVAVLVHETGGIWPVARYMGLSCDLSQFVYVPNMGWILAGDVGTSCLQLCPRIYAIVTANGRTARVDGVTCCVHASEDFPSTEDTSTRACPLFAA